MPASRPPSSPLMSSSTIAAASSVVRVIGPILSIVQDSAIAPPRETRPPVGRSPVVPQNAAGQRMLPHVSVPMANPTNAAATAAPEPDDDPPDQCSGFQGVRPGPGHTRRAVAIPDASGELHHREFAKQGTARRAQFFDNHGIIIDDAVFVDRRAPRRRRIPRCEQVFNAVGDTV